VPQIEYGRVALRGHWRSWVRAMGVSMCNFSVLPRSATDRGADPVYRRGLMNTMSANSLARTEGRQDASASDVTRLGDSPPSRSLAFVAALACLLIVGCAMGPDFKRPAAPDVSDYTGRPLSTTVASTNIAGGQAQSFAKGIDIADDWWTLFHSKPLNELIEQSLTKNPNLKSAQAALSVATENVLAQRGAYYPAVTGSFSPSR
jgi:hypothetical protein